MQAETEKNMDRHFTGVLKILKKVMKPSSKSKHIEHSIFVENKKNNVTSYLMKETIYNTNYRNKN